MSFFNNCCICDKGGIVCFTCSKIYFNYVLHDIYKKGCDLLNELPFDYEQDCDYDTIYINDLSLCKFYTYMETLFAKKINNYQVLYKIYIHKNICFNPLLYLLLSDEKEYVDYILGEYERLQYDYKFHIDDEPILKIDKIHRILSQRSDIPDELKIILKSIKQSNSLLRTYKNEDIFNKCMFCEDGNFICSHCSYTIFSLPRESIALNILWPMCLNIVRRKYNNQISKTEKKYFITAYWSTKKKIIFTKEINNPLYPELRLSYQYIFYIYIIWFSEFFFKVKQKYSLYTFLISFSENLYLNPLLYLLLDIEEEEKEKIINLWNQLDNCTFSPHNNRLIKLKPIKKLLKKYNNKQKKDYYIVSRLNYHIPIIYRC